MGGEARRRLSAIDAGFPRLCARARAARRQLDIWSTAYLHILDGEDAVLNWISGSALRPYFARLDAEERAGFEADLAARLKRAYPPESDGRTYFPFHRLFVIAAQNQKDASNELTGGAHG